MYIEVEKFTKSIILTLLVIIAFIVSFTDGGNDVAIIFLWLYTIVNVVLKSNDGQF